MSQFCQPIIQSIYFGHSAFSGEMLLVRIVENNKFDAYFRAG